MTSPLAKHHEPEDDHARSPKKRATKTKGAHEPQPVAIVDNLDWQKEYFVNHRLESAQIPRRFWNKTLANFETKGDVKRKRLVADAEHFIKGFTFQNEFPKGLFMSGPVGCGKSHLASAILREIIRKGYSGLFYNSPDLLRDIRATFDEGSELTEDTLLEYIEEVDLLVLDDLGAEKVSEFVLDRFYLIVNKRYEGCKPLIVTTNYDEETLKSRFGERLMSRLIEMCEAFGPFPIEDYRRRHVAAQARS